MISTPNCQLSNLFILSFSYILTFSEELASEEHNTDDDEKSSDSGTEMIVDMPMSPTRKRKVSAEEPSENYDNVEVSEGLCMQKLNSFFISFFCITFDS